MKILIYLKNNFWKYVFIFFVVSFIGYFWEVSKHFILYGKFVNRGAMYGPYLPIYGLITLAMILLLHKLKKRWITLYLASGLVCSSLEYIGSIILEKMFGLRWWSYFKYPFNIQGRTCLYSFLLFGLFGLLSIKYLIPFLERLYEKLKKYNINMILLLLLIVYSIDVVYSYTNPNTGKSISYDVKEKN